MNMDNEHTAPQDDAVETLIAEILGEESTEASKEQSETLPINPQMLAKLPLLLSALGDNKKRPPDKQTALLLALKPYLGSKRCEAIDYIAKVKSIRDTLKHLGS